MKVFKNNFFSCHLDPDGEDEEENRSYFVEMDTLYSTLKKYRPTGNLHPHLE